MKPSEITDKQEIVSAIIALKNRKSPGQDNMNAELFKVDPELAIEIRQPLYLHQYEKEK